MKKRTNNFLIIVLTLLVFACKEDSKSKNTEAPRTVNVPTFNGDSAYAFVQKQVDFGFRIPGREEHKMCKEWLGYTLSSYGGVVKEQEFKASFFDAANVTATNIIAQFNTEQKKRILLAAHWDSRSVADKETDESEKKKPIAGADDGGSGVGVLLEIARTISTNPIELGVDIVLFDAEDQGDAGDLCRTTCSWCLGSQYWAKNLYPKNYKPEYGILLDMVGARNASFYKEGYSRNYAQAETNKIWTLAGRMGYSDYFIERPTSPIIDDHLFINEIARIPMLNIVNLKPGTGESMFHQCHHTQCDNINFIEKRTLRVVGQVVTAVLYKESGNTL